jgi:Tfp pilus assembly pilus retraction ATPase PilT
VAVELLPWSVALYKILRDGRTHQIPALLQREGAVRLDAALAELVRSQKVTAETARQYAIAPADIPVPGGWTSARKS